MKIIVHPAGDDSVFYSEQANRQLGLALITEFEKAASLVSGNPELGTPWVSGTRRFVLRRFPLTSYIVFCLIIVIAHQKRRPGYWHLRK